MRSGHILLTLLFVTLIMTAIPQSSAESQARWRSPDELPGYPYRKEDPWAWKEKASQIGTSAAMDFGEHRKGMRPLVNFYIDHESKWGGCKDPEALKVYRNYMEEAVAMLTAYRDWFVRNYPQFSYLKKLRFQVSDGPVDRALNIPVWIHKSCFEARPSVTQEFWWVFLSSPTSTIHEFVHAFGGEEICLGGFPRMCERPYYSFYTPWGWIGDIGMNTLTWYAIALSWSWLYFYDEHPGTAADDYASKLPSKPKYTALYTGKSLDKELGIEVQIYRYVVTLQDMLESGVVPRIATNIAEFKLGGGAIVPNLGLWPEEWMVGHPVLDYVDSAAVGSVGDKVMWSWVFRGQAELALSIGSVISYTSFLSSDYNLLRPDWPDMPIYMFYFFDTLVIVRQPWTDIRNLRYLLFPDLRPDLYFCGYVYRWHGQKDERVLFDVLVGNESFRPTLRPGERITYRIDCFYQWGPYVYRAPVFYFVEPPLPTKRDTSGREYQHGVFVIVGVPASEKVIQESPGTRKVFSGVWLVNGTVYPGPYLDLDILGWKVEGEPPKRRPLVTGRVPGARIQPGLGPDLYLYDPNGPIYLENFTQRYRTVERVPWMVGVTILKLRHNTTAEPLYYREHLVNITIPEGFTVLEGNLTGWYREGTKIRLPKLSELQVSRGTKLVHEGWRDVSGRVYVPGEEVVVDGPRSLEPILVRYHLVSVKGPEELRHEGSGWYREGSVARLRVAENVTYVSDRSRYVFLGFRSDNEVVNEVEVRVDGPVEVEAVWRREHLLTVRSRFLNWTFENPWFEEDRTYMIIIPGDVQDLGNGTMIEVKGVEVLSGGRKFTAERADLQTIEVTVGGARTIVLWNATFTVHGPIEMHVLWTVRYALEVKAPSGVVSIKDSSVQLPGTVFVEEGEKVTLEFREVQLTGVAGRLVLHDVMIDGVSHGPVPSAEIEVKRPVTVMAVYREQVLVWPRLKGQDGSTADPDVVVLRSELGEVISEGGKAVWLDRNLTPGGDVEWVVEKAVYRGVEVTVRVAVKAEEPGTIAIPAEISSLTVKVRDVFGMPVPFANVAYSGPGGEVRASTDYSGIARLGVVPNGGGRVSAGLIGASVGEVPVPPGEHTVVLPVSPYTIAILASLIPPGYVVMRGWRRRSPSMRRGSS